MRDYLRYNGVLECFVLDRMVCVCEMISRLVAIECLLTANVCRFFLLNTKRNVWIIVETRR